MSNGTKSPVIAIQGEIGAFSEQAARAYFAGAASLLPCRLFVDVFDAVDTGRAQAAVVPIENTLAGSVGENYDLLLRYPLQVTGEIVLRVSHCLLALPGVEEHNIRRIYSHPQALDQCRTFLSSRRHVDTVLAEDTAGSAKFIKDHKLTDAAAIAGARAAEIYGLHILGAGIEDNPQNFTRFFIVENKNSRPPQVRITAKTSVVFGLPNAPGALFRALSVFATRDINVLKIESRPLWGGPWHYTFFLDFEGAATDESCSRALAELTEVTNSFRLLGTYVKGKVVL